MHDSAAFETIRVGIRNVRSFQDVNGLRRAVGTLPGVEDVTLRVDGCGGVSLVVAYDGVVPFAVHLNELLRRQSSARLPEGLTIEEYEVLTPAAGSLALAS